MSKDWSDIVDVLSKPQDFLMAANAEYVRLCGEASLEIERLRAENAFLKGRLAHSEQMHEHAMKMLNNAMARITHASPK